MLHIGAVKDQHVWVKRRPAIEFAMNLAVSETTGLSPFFLHYGQTPRATNWQQTTHYRGVMQFAQLMKCTIMHAHNCIIDVCAKQTHQANKK